MYANGPFESQEPIVVHSLFVRNPLDESDKMILRHFYAQISPDDDNDAEYSISDEEFCRLSGISEIGPPYTDNAFEKSIKRFLSNRIILREGGNLTQFQLIQSAKRHKDKTISVKVSADLRRNLDKLMRLLCID
ncbi:MAG: hypothetical protein LBU32_12425 [Clostridiales bacterium]|jgi:hypothetical protein|nr:hypothetical protein [Clostridiales bacterium]